MKKLWSIWAKTMGTKISDNDREADTAAIVRTFFFLLNVVTCIFIILNNGRLMGYWK
jgi:type IV secretory pathway component VirB8